MTRHRSTEFAGKICNFSANSEYTKYEENNIPDIKEGAKEFLEKLYKTGRYELVLFTTRDIKLAEKWLKKEQISDYFTGITNIKKPAYIYIDDRALNFKGDYNKTFEEIENFKVHWKNEYLI